VISSQLYVVTTVTRIRTVISKTPSMCKLHFRNFLSCFFVFTFATCLLSVKLIVDRFLGHFRPRLGRPALWELDSDQHNIGRSGSNLDIENMRYTTFVEKLAKPEISHVTELIYGSIH